MSDKQQENLRHTHSDWGLHMLTFMPSQLQTVMVEVMKARSSIESIHSNRRGTDSGGLLGEFSGQSRKSQIKTEKKIKSEK